MTTTILHPVTPAHPARTLATICVPMFLVLLDVNIVQVALPRIGAGLGMEPESWSALVAFYTLPLAATLIIAGRTCDRVGYRRMLAAGEAIFLAGSVGAALAPSWAIILAARTVQGLGAAAMLPASLAALTTLWQDRAARAKVLGIWSAVSAAATAVGPVTGGLLIAAASWRLIFVINIPLCVAALLALSRLPVVGPGPVSHRRTVRAGPLTGATTAAFLMTAVGNGVLIAVTMYLQRGQGFSALSTGAMMLAATVPFAVLGPVTGVLVNRVGRRVLAAVGLAIGAGMLLALTQAEPGGHTAWTVVGLLGVGVGLGLMTACIVGEGMEAIPGAQGLAGGINNTARQLGTTAGVVASGAVVAHATRFAAGLNLVGALAAGTWLLGAVVVLFLFMRRGE